MINNLINSNDVCFFIEHWLGDEEAYLFNELLTNHSIIFKADYNNYQFSTTKEGKAGLLEVSVGSLATNSKLLNIPRLMNPLADLLLRGSKLKGFASMVYGNLMTTAL